MSQDLDMSQSEGSSFTASSKQHQAIAEAAVAQASKRFELMFAKMAKARDEQDKQLQ